MTKRIKSIIAALLAGCTVFSGSIIPVNALSLYDMSAKDNYSLLQGILDLYVETSLYKTEKSYLIEQMLYNFIAQNPELLPALANAALSANDPYSAYHMSTSGFMASTSKSYGIVVSDSDSFPDDAPRKAVEGVYITDVVKGSNAEFAGLLPGDRIVSLDGMNVEGLTNLSVRYLLAYFPLVNKDPENSKVFNEFSSTEITDAKRY